MKNKINLNKNLIIKNTIKKRIRKDKLFKNIVLILTYSIIIPLILIIGYLIMNGIKVFSINFLTKLPHSIGQNEMGGIANAIVGSLLITFIALIIAIPIGILTGIYITEFKKNKFSKIIKYSIETLNDIPTIIIGMIIYTIFIETKILSSGFSALAGSISLSLIMIPMITKSTAQSLNEVSASLKYAAISMGVPQYKTILYVSIPSALGGIISGIFFCLARTFGITAPLLFTVGGNRLFLNLDIMKPTETLQHLIFNNYQSSFSLDKNLAWGASFVLITFVIIFYSIAKIGMNRWKKQF